MRFTKCMGYCDDHSVTQSLVRHVGHLKKDKLSSLCWFFSEDLISPSISWTPWFRNNWVFREVTPATGKTATAFTKISNDDPRTFKGTVFKQ